MLTFSPYEPKSEPASYKQNWALFCLTKVDHRPLKLTKDEASAKIAELMAAKEPRVKKTKDANPAVLTIINKAHAAGRAALGRCNPIPMVVLDGSRAYHVATGCCGFAWITVKSNTPENRKFVSGLKKLGLVGDHSEWSKGTYGGYTYWVSVGGQSMELKSAFASAFADVLNKYGITAYTQSRMD
jgi:hypothetical protein